MRPEQPSASARSPAPAAAAPFLPAALGGAHGGRLMGSARPLLAVLGLRGAEQREGDAGRPAARSLAARAPRVPSPGVSSAKCQIAFNDTRTPPRLRAGLFSARLISF